MSMPTRGRDYRLEVIRPPMTTGEIQNHLMFAHTIPASDDVRKTLRSVRPAHKVSVRGYLVDIEKDSNIYWQSSYNGRGSRLDGSQVLYIEHLEIQ